MKTLLVPVLRWILPGLFLALVFHSCKKDDNFGLDIINLPGDRFGINYTDTFFVAAWSKIEDSLQTSGVTMNLLGSYFDPVFGKVTAGIFTEMLLSTNNVSFGNNPVGDSLILTLRFNGYYGDSSFSHRVRVYEIDQNASFSKDSVYYSNQTLPYNQNQPLYDGVLAFNPVDSTWFDGKKVPALLQIPMNNVLIDKLIGASGGSDLLNNDAFRKFFRGLYITVDQINNYNQGVMGYFNMNADLSALTLYYHNDKDTVKYPFLINTDCAKFTHFDHDGYQDAAADLRNQDTTGENSRVFLQPMAGQKIVVKTPYIMDLVKNKPAAIARAELVLKTDQSDPSASTYTPPPRVTIARINDEGKNAFISDVIEGETFMGGTYDPVKKEYRFRITRYIQDILKGKYNNNGLVVMVSGGSVMANRVVILGNKVNDRNLKLEIVFANP